MAETKKRFRPTLTAYRALENEVSELKEELSKYKMMEKCGIPQSDEATKIELCSLRSKYHQLKVKYDTLIKSNELLEQERDRNHQALSDMSKLNKQLSNKLQAIKSRGFWKRLFNRE